MRYTSYSRYEARRTNTTFVRKDKQSRCQVERAICRSESERHTVTFRASCSGGTCSKLPPFEKSLLRLTQFFRQLTLSIFNFSLFETHQVLSAKLPRMRSPRKSPSTSRRHNTHLPYLPLVFSLTNMVFRGVYPSTALTVGIVASSSRRYAVADHESLECNSTCT
jgi:hypothetical protein